MPRIRLALLAALAAACLGVTVVAAQEANNPEVVETRQRFNDAYHRQDYARAIRLGLELAELAPGRPLDRYNLACVYALAGDPEAALDWLEEAARSGLTNTRILARDPDLDGLRELPRFAAIAAAVRHNAARVAAVVEERFASAPPLIFVPRRHDSSQPSPLVISLHGYGGRPDGYPAYWRTAAGKVGAILACPRGVRALGSGFFWGDVDEADTILRLTIEHVKARHAVADDRIVLTGFSQGGYMALALGVRHPEQFAGVVPMAGGYIPAIDAPPRASGENEPRYFFMVGALDDNREESELAARDFEQAGYATKLRIYPGVGHAYPRFTDYELGKALKFILGR